MNKNRRRGPVKRKVFAYIKDRVSLVFFLILGLMLLMFVRILYINRHSGEDYNKRILTQMAYSSQTIEAERGLIYDRNGTVLALNQNYYDVILEPKNILERENLYLEATVQMLTEYFELDAQEVEAKIRKNPESYYLPIVSDITEAQYKEVQAYIEEYNEKDAEEKISEEERAAESASQAEAVQADDAEEGSGGFFDFVKEAAEKVFKGEKKAEKPRNKKIAGVQFARKQRREYPYNRLASPLIGFVNKTGENVQGLERYYDSLLSGTDGRIYGYLNSEASVQTQIVDAKDGYSLMTTIDAYIQKVCEDVINKYEKDIGSNVTGIMVMNPNNGEIYAMAQSRQFDANKPGDLSDIYTKKELEKMSEDDKSAALMERWRSFCVASSYEPGSTAKVFTIAAALEEECIGSEDTYVCDGVGPYGIHCHKRSGHGKVNVTGSLMSSCNDALMQIGKQVGVDVFCDYQSKFNLGATTGIDLPDEFSCSELIYRADRMTDIDLMTNSFGQNYYVTMVQMCAAYASLVNGGNYYQPHLAKRILDSDGKVIENIEPVLVRQTVSHDTSEFMKEALFQVVEKGTANRVRIEGYEIGSKTGTAEKANKGAARETYTVSLMSVAPAYDPEVIVYVVVDEPQCEKAENTYQAKDLSKAVIEKILPYLNIYPSGGEVDVDNTNGNFTDPEDDELFEEAVEAGQTGDRG